MDGTDAGRQTSRRREGARLAQSDASTMEEEKDGGFQCSFSIHFNSYFQSTFHSNHCCTLLGALMDTALLKEGVRFGQTARPGPARFSHTHFFILA